MRWSTFAFAFLAAVAVAEDSSTQSTTETSDKSTTTDGPTVVSITTPVAIPSGTYEQVSTTRTLADGDTEVLTSTTATGHHNGTMTTSGNGTVITTTSNALTLLVGGAGTTTIGNSSMNATMTSSGTATASPVVNQQPCNNYPQFCARKYSNITMVAAHNSPFVRKNNVAANQVLDVTQQLNDGIRMCELDEPNLRTLERTRADLILCSAIPDALREWHYVSLPYHLPVAGRGNSRGLSDTSQ